LGKDATEDCFKKEAPGSRIIHFATHGYFLEGICADDGREDDLSSDGEWAGENPLLQSGLFLAGANLHGKGADSAGVDDGILTAYEVSALDLSGTETVVLSACETGLGRIQEGEGVYGLRRAFQMAGVRTVISALWPVLDPMTSELFSSLYERSSLNISQALQQVQLNKLGELRAENKIDHPAQWAAFIVLGDWR
ncbi:MAG: CHAT domain-containing protein, partial [Candidatus Zixiibacteriota bacterium]